MRAMKVLKPETNRERGHAPQPYKDINTFSTFPGVPEGT
jgi:hypothetical protein